MITLSDSIKLVNETFVKLGCPELVGKVKVEWNSRFKTTMGDANYIRKRIRLAKRLFLYTSLEDQEDTVVHEACHIVVCHKFPWASSHGHHWKSTMRHVGRKPERCHTLDTYKLGISKRRKRYVVNCGCVGGCEVGPTVVKRLQSGIKYRCKKCGKPLSSVGMTVKE